MSLDIFIKCGYKEKQLKSLIETTIFGGETVYLDFTGVEIIDEKEYIDLFRDHSGDIDFLKKIRIKEATPGIKRSLYMALNKIERKISF